MFWLFENSTSAVIRSCHAYSGVVHMRSLLIRVYPLCIRRMWHIGGHNILRHNLPLKRLWCVISVDSRLSIFVN